MHFSTTLPLATAFLLSAAPFALAGPDFDAEDVPRSCLTVCGPIHQLVRQCDADDHDVGGDRNEDLLERQCICENKSFDVARTAGECQSCIETVYKDSCNQRNNDHDDDNCGDYEDGREDIHDIMRACQFSSVSYDAAATTSAQSVSVSATKPTSLTTTINPEETGIFGNGDSANTDNSNNNNNDDATTEDATTEEEGAAAQGALPGMVLSVAGAVVAGAFMLQ